MGKAIKFGLKPEPGQHAPLKSKSHHEIYLTIFSKATLKPKHLYMLHYPEVIRRVGLSVAFDGKLNTDLLSKQLMLQILVKICL